MSRQGTENETQMVLETFEEPQPCLSQEKCKLQLTEVAFLS